MSAFTLSVIIPNYNKSQYLTKCIESIMVQTRIPDEIIVVDDCSTDSSLATLKNLQEQYSILKVLVLDKNSGVSCARNRGLQAATSEYVTFLDSDDYYYDCTKLFKEMALIEKYYKQEDIVAYSPIVRVDTENNLLRCNSLKKYWYSQGDIYYDLISCSKHLTAPRDYCVKKSVLEEVGGYSYPINFYEDLDLLIRLSKKVKFYCTFGYGTAYRSTPAGLSKRSPAEHKSAVNSIVQKYQHELSVPKRAFVVFKKYKWKITSKLFRVLKFY